ncbi:MAG TPA: MSMEG_0570 family nitrogen starvation response protein, partial [Nodosilinea sp.]|nr:MSMEG_0570 family nitrogen starvation response protein [Nodosilinea sp.]
QWPDGHQETCYSPSLVVKDYFAVATTYPLADFVARSRTALTIASDRVHAKYGMPCSLALAQLRRIETTASRFEHLPTPAVTVLEFME